MHYVKQIGSSSTQYAMKREKDLGNFLGIQLAKGKQAMHAKEKS